MYKFLRSLSGGTAKVIIFVSLLIGGSVAQTNREEVPDVRIDLYTHGLPKGFFRTDADTKCAGQIIGYRFVVWLGNERVAVGFNTSPNCRVSRNRKVNGSARVFVFDVQGNLKASRDLPYEADGDGIVVADGQAAAGPGGTLIFGIQEVHKSKSGVLLLDGNLKDVARIDRFLEQTTFVHHALVFQDGFTLSGSRTYSILDGVPPLETARWQQDWPVGAMDRKFGEQALAFMLCQQELTPNVYTSSNVVYAGAKRRCTMTVQLADRTAWNAALEENATASIVGLLADGSVAGQVEVKGSKAGQAVIWKKDQSTEILPWIARNARGAVQSATPNMSRYATFATEDGELCENLERLCSDNGRWVVFDRKSQTPIVDRVFPKNGRAALSPDGQRYASFEAGELRIYPLAQP
ncbi:MAG TPA: hypothetical protein VN911_20030 [Candidatus Acidoferrum sp.]|nr:hypothetical protein [Candidatus Acidoferrum sp.]